MERSTQDSQLDRVPEIVLTALSGSGVLGDGFQAQTPQVAPAETPENDRDQGLVKLARWFPPGPGQVPTLRLYMDSRLVGFLTITLPAGTQTMVS